MITEHIDDLIDGFTASAYDCGFAPGAMEYVVGWPEDKPLPDSPWVNPEDGRVWTKRGHYWYPNRLTTETLSRSPEMAQVSTNYHDIYTDQLRRLHTMISDGQSDSAAADALREAMDEPWQRLSDAERTVAETLSASLSKAIK